MNTKTCEEEYTKAQVICPKCAKAQGLQWPEGHVATFWHGTCDVCNKFASVCDIHDYDGPHMTGKNKDMVRD